MITILCKKRRKRFIVLSALILLLIVGNVWQRVMVNVEVARMPVVGAYVDTGAYQMHYVSKGTGNPVIVFIAGSGTPCAYTDFYYLQEQLSTTNQTVSFDHAGSGWSTDALETRSIEHLVTELSILIDVVASEKQVILVCHSLGSLEAIAYAQAYPEKVEGIVFLDSGSPEFYSEDSEFTSKLLNRMNTALRLSGLNRLLGECGLLLPMYGESVRNHNLSYEIQKLDKMMYYRYMGNRANLSGIEMMNENAKQVLSGARLNELPVLVISSDSGSEWNKVAQQLAGWSEHSEQVTLPESEHYLHWSNKGEVTDYIQNFVEQLSK